MNPMSHRWPKSAVRLARKTTYTAVAAALLTLSASTAVHALSLGPIVVQSALGEPLRAEIDILEINAEESASLRASVASPEAFRAAGLDYNAAMANLRVTLQRRANGRSFIRLNSDRPVNDPFVDMILEANWSSGRIVRDYTMLFDPPNLRASAVTAAPVTPAATQEATALPSAVAASPANSARPAAPAAKPAAAPAAKGVAAAKPMAPVKAGEGQITVKPGDTASKIAMATKPANVSLDQMLVALLRANPDAFVNSNLNRIKSGAVLNVPTPEQAAAMGAKEASQTVIAQSRDFGDFRKKLAGVAPTAQVAAADRQSGGSVQTKVDDKKPSAAAPDKLTLSKGALAAQANADKLAKELAAKEAAAKNSANAKINADLSKLSAASAPTVSGTPAVAAGAKPAAASASAPMPAGAPAVVATAPAPAALPAAAPTAPAAASVAPAASAAIAAKPASSAPAKPVAVAPMAAPPEPALIDQLTENPLVPAAGAGLVALLAGFGVYRARQRKKAQEMDSAFLESRLQPDSFFGASGGQKVDTQDSQQGGGSSMVYTPSQLDAADDVDPVAEADVYLAYGRDVQAEEILKEALKTNAGRIAIHQKLLEIYAKRRDTRNFELAASEAFKICNGEGPEWTRICDQGLGIDPSNPLYMPGGKPQIAVGIPSQPASLEMITAVAKASAPAAVGVSTVPLAATASAAAAAGLATVALSANSFNATTSSMSAQPTQASSVDLDFDLDFSLDEDNAKVISDLGGAQQTSKMQAVDSGSVPLDMNFDLPTAPSTVSSPMASATNVSPLEFDLPGVSGLSNSGEVSRPAPLMPSSGPSFAPSGGLSLAPAPVDLEEFKQQAAVSFGTTVAGPLATFAPKAAEPAAPMPGLMEFDLGSLSLELEDSTPGGKEPTFTAPITASTPLEDPLATKLSLAEEFNSIGDHDGARALIEEVLLEATGDVKTKAQQALAKMS